MAEAARAALIPPQGSGRPHATGTKLGKLIRVKGLKVYEVGAAAHIAPRTMTELIAGRMTLSNAQCVRLCMVLRCKADEILE